VNAVSPTSCNRLAAMRGGSVDSVRRAFVLADLPGTDLMLYLLERLPDAAVPGFIRAFEQDLGALSMPVGELASPHDRENLPSLRTAVSAWMPLVGILDRASFLRGKDSQRELDKADPYFARIQDATHRVVPVLERGLVVLRKDTIRRGKIVDTTPSQVTLTIPGTGCGRLRFDRGTGLLIAADQRKYAGACILATSLLRLDCAEASPACGPEGVVKGHR